MRFTQAENSEREALFARVLAAQSQSEIDAARAALRSWRDRFPDDPGLRSAFNDLRQSEVYLSETD